MAEVDARDGVWGAPAPPELEERARSVLAELARENDASVSFQGLRRQLGLHQQVLTRTLRRLEAAGLVARAQSGYQLTEHGARIVRPPSGGTSSVPVSTLVRALLPPHASEGAVVAQLARRWFGGLRWYGQASSGEETSLHWAVEPGGHRVTVRVTPGALALDAEVPPQEAARVFAAARPVLAAIAELYGAAPEPPRDARAMFAPLLGMAG